MDKISKYKKRLLEDELNSSDEDNLSDTYQSALMSSLIALSNNKKSDNSTNTDENDDKKPTENRIEFVKNILDGNKLKPMVDFDNCDTESITNTRLNKK